VVPFNTDRTKIEIFEPHGYFRTLELVRPSFAHNPTRFPKKKISTLIAWNQTGSGFRATGRRFVDYMNDVCMKDACPGHPPHAQTARPDVKLLKHPLRQLNEARHNSSIPNGFVQHQTAHLFQ